MTQAAVVLGLFFKKVRQVEIKRLSKMDNPDNNDNSLPGGR